MISERRIHEAYTFLNKKGKVYALDIATDSERKHFEGILYKNGIPSDTLVNYPTHVSIK